MIDIKFIKSEWFVPEFGNWHLKPNAPKEIVDEFNEYMMVREEALKNGIIID